MLYEPSPVLSGLESVLERTDYPWALELVGEDQADKFATVMSDLRRRHSVTGDGKRITSGYSYMGIEPTIAWANACGDRLYPVMKQSIESFAGRWASVRPSLGAVPYHYVSLGPGDGQKDAVVLQDLRRDNAQLCYVPVDTSTEMLRLAVRDLIRQLTLSRKRILSLSLDFSVRENLAELRRLLTGMFGDTPVLFSLLGNTMANVDDDTELLGMLATELLRPRDRFLLEVATTSSLDNDVADAAATEYERSRSFGEFVTSAVRRYTDLHVDMDSVEYQGSVERGHALLIKIIYRNQTGREIPITLPDRDSVRFRPDDTIRLYMTRKYAQERLGSMLAASRVRKVAGTHADFTAANNRPRFGMELMILAAQPEGAQPGATRLERTLADDVWG
ncbi:MAG TPA: L-histidine N(alpha)-methyltransferase [Mycobacteriales bacterium]|nr:L-histidine N(alpha)-methyltransferase [Mycobacteriales bacterium]